MINNDVCDLGQLGSVRVRDLMPCKSLLKIVKSPFLPHGMISLLFNEDRSKSFLRTATPLTDIQTDRQTQGETEDGLHSGTDLNSCSRQAEDRKPGEHEVENLNLDSLLLKCFQGEVLLFIYLFP